MNRRIFAMLDILRSNWIILVFIVMILFIVLGTMYM